MDPHRVFVIWSHPLFLESMRLLLQHADIDWIGASRHTQEAVNAIGCLNPDTVLIEAGENGSVTNEVIGIFENRSTNLRVFQLSLADNDLKIFHHEKRTDVQANELIRLIRGGE